MTAAAHSNGKPPAAGRQPRWTEPYRPLRARTLLLQVLVLSIAEAWLLRSYAARHALFDWATHLLVGFIAAALWLSVYLLIAARPARGQLLTILWFHLVAIVPDHLFSLGVAHARWMNVFLGHTSVQELPGGNTAWLVLALLALAGYILLLARWLAARDAEAARGMPPGIGIGGVAVVRAQRDPNREDLAHWHRGPDSAGPVLVLLHGLGTTAASWAEVATRLAEAGVATVSVDLLGHGASRTLGTRFTLVDQAHAVVRLLNSRRLGRVTLVGHSWGAAVAAAVAWLFPQRVERVLLIAPPAYAHPVQARHRLGQRSWLARCALADGPLASTICGLMCLTRGVLGRLAVRARPDLAAAVARSAVDHTYPAYRDGLDALLQPDGELTWALRRPRHPTSVLLAADDDRVHPADIWALRPARAVEVVQIPGDHCLPVSAPQPVIDFVLPRLQALPGDQCDPTANEGR